MTSHTFIIVYHSRTWRRQINLFCASWFSSPKTLSWSTVHSNMGFLKGRFAGTAPRNQEKSVIFSFQIFRLTVKTFDSLWGKVRKFDWFRRLGQSDPVWSVCYRLNHVQGWIQDFFFCWGVGALRMWEWQAKKKVFTSQQNKMTSNNKKVKKNYNFLLVGGAQPFTNV